MEDVKLDDDGFNELLPFTFDGGRRLLFVSTGRLVKGSRRNFFILLFVAIVVQHLARIYTI